MAMSEDEINARLLEMGRAMYSDDDFAVLDEQQIQNLVGELRAATSDARKTEDNIFLDLIQSGLDDDT